MLIVPLDFDGTLPPPTISIAINPIIAYIQHPDLPPEIISRTHFEPPLS